MTKRKGTPLGEQVAILKRQAICPLCRCPLGEGPLDLDHGWALARGGGDEVLNKAFVHRDCHAAKTRGSGATTRGSDIGEIAKSKRLTAKEEAFRLRVLEKAPGVPRAKSGKIRSRGFR